MTRYDLKGDDGSYTLDVTGEDGDYTVVLGETSLQIRFSRGPAPGAVTAVISGKPAAVEISDIAMDRVAFTLDGERYVFRRGGTAPVPSAPAKESEKLVAGSVSAPMPGRVIAALAKAGEAVKKGDPLVILESMKMEVAVRADRDGVVAEVLVKEGEAVRRGQGLVRLETS